MSVVGGIAEELFADRMLKHINRLTKRGSFTYVYNKGERKSARLLSLVFVPGKNLKIGFSVPNKIGKATVRNRVKRRLRAIVRELVPGIRPAQIVITARSGAEAMAFLELKTDVRGLFERTKLLMPQSS